MENRFEWKGYTLREAAMEDAPAIFNAIDAHRDYLSVWLPFVPLLRSAADEEAFLRSVLDVPHPERNLVFVIERHGAVCGLVGFVSTDAANHRTEIGYWLLPEHQGKGVMTNMVRHLCRWCAAERNINRIQIRCAAGNRLSNAIPLRLGFTLEGAEREGELLASGQYADINVYSLLRSEIR